ncbi:MAG: choice-of-anchor D domain-containing protein, partial [Roseimicrobium sp.]
RVITAFASGASAAHSVAVRRNGLIIVGGYVDNGTDTDIALVRYLSNGALDTSFDGDGKVTTSFGGYEEANSVIVQPDGGILVAGFARIGDNADFALARYLANGSLDSTFGNNGKVTTALGVGEDVAQSMAVQVDGYLLLAGHTQNGTAEDFALVRYEANPVVVPATLVVEEPALATLASGSSRSFGTVVQGGSSTALTFSVFNEGTQTLILNSVAASGGQAVDFVVNTTGMASSLGSQQSTTFTVRFAPQGIGQRSTSLQIATNDAQSPFTLTLSGTGASAVPDIAVSGNSQPIGDGDLTPGTGDGTDFGSANVGNTVTRTFTIANTGTAALQLTGTAPHYVTVSGGGGAFTVSQQPGSSTVAVGGSSTFQVAFAPSAAGGRSAVVTVANNDGDENNYQFAIQGTGIGVPEIAVETSTGTSLTSGAGTLDLGAVTTGTGAASAVLTVRNVGTAALSLGSVTKSGGAASEFTLSTAGMPASLAPGEATSFGVLLTTTTLGSRSTTLAIANGDSNENPFLIAVTGTGVAAAPVAGVRYGNQVIARGDTTPGTADGTDFGGTFLGVPVTRSFSITNTGTAALHLTGTAPSYVSLSGSAAFTVTTQPTATIAAGATSTFQVTFDPATVATHTATISFAHDDATGSPFTFAIQGAGNGRPDLDVEDANGLLLADQSSGVDFGLVQVGSTSAAKTFVLQNRGTAALTVSSVTTSGVNAGDFAVITTGMQTSVAVGASTSLQVTFSPQAGGQRSTTLVIASNDPDEAPYEIALSGAALPEIAVSGNQVNITDGDSTPQQGDHTVFGEVAVAGGTLRRSYRVSNNGTADLVVGTATLSGTHAGDFSVTQQPSASVAPGDFTTLEVEFNPTGLDLRTAVVSFANNDSNENPFNFSIQGTGTGPGQLDRAFGTLGRVTTDLNGADERGRALALQSDGKALVAGYTDNGTNSNFVLVRYLADGSLDASFGVNGKVSTDLGNGSLDQASAVAVQADGKIVAAGFAQGGSNEDVALVRYLSDGTLDTSFGTGGKVLTPVGSSDDRAAAVVVQPDGKIVIAGTTFSGSNSDVLLVRYLPNGSLDTSFGSGGKVITGVGVEDAAFSLALQRNGRLVVAGKASNGLHDDVAVLRYLANGSLDTTFGTGGVVTTSVAAAHSAAQSVVVRRTGEIVVGGYASNADDTDWLVARYLANGSLDTTFGTGGLVVTSVGAGYEEVSSVAVQANGSVIATGFTQGANDDLAVARFLPNGSLDSGFGTGGKVVTALGSGGDYGLSVKALASGYVLAAGYTQGSSDDIALVRYVGEPVVLPQEIVVEQPYGSETATGSTVDFGTVLVGESQSLEIVVLNDGTQPLTISGVTKAGTASSDYTVDDSALTTSLGEGGESSFTITLSPSAPGTRT